MSITGPNGDGTCDTSTFEVEKYIYEFHGLNNLPKRYSDFYEDLVQYMGEQPQWSKIGMYSVCIVCGYI